MAIRLQGQLSTVSGETTGSYLRIEYVKFMPWVGEVEYNPMLFRNEVESGWSRRQFYEDPLPTSSLLVPLISMSLNYENNDYDVEIDEIIKFPITGALEEVTVDHYAETLHSASVIVTDFDENGNEVTSSDFTYWNQYSIYSQSIQEKTPIELGRTGSILEQCYTHLKGYLAEQVPSGSILDV